MDITKEQYEDGIDKIFKFLKGGKNPFYGVKITLPELTKIVVWELFLYGGVNVIPVGNDEVFCAIQDCRIYAKELSEIGWVTFK